MAAAFPLPRMGTTKYGGQCIIYEPMANPGFVHVFTIKTRRPNNPISIWKCSECHALKLRDPQRPPVPLITMENGRFRTDPENPLNPHFCQMKTSARAEADQLQHEAREKVKQTGKRPRAAYREVLVEATKRFADDPLQRQAVHGHIKSFKKIRTSWYGAYNDRFPVIPAIPQIPENLRLTLEGSVVAPTDPHHQDRLLIHSQAVPPFLIFASRQDFRFLHQSAHWVADGTFAYRPQDYPFAQLYIIGFVNGEAVAAVDALMPDRSQATYEILLTTVRNHLIQQFGTIGSLTHGHFDFECASLAAFRVVFPNAQGKGCIFHFAKSLNEQVGKRGLKPVYDQTGEYNQPQYVVFKVWIRRIVALALLPPGLMLQFWNCVLNVPPYTGNAVVDHNLAEFSDYVFRQWLRTPEKRELLSHYNHDGPRTNNNAEGYNSSLSSKFERVHPRLSIFLVQFQEAHHEIQMRARDLLDNLAAPNERHQRYIDNDQRISAAKDNFSTTYNGLDNTDPNFRQTAIQVVYDYLDTVEHLLG